VARRGTVALCLAGSFLAGCHMTSASTASNAWNYDYQTGDLSQWHAIEAAAPGRVSIVTSPARPGYPETARFVVEPGDHTNSPKSERAEVSTTQEQAGGYEGVETWYGWSTLFPTDLNPPAGKTSIFTQWHQTKSAAAESCPPNVAFKVDARRSPTSILLTVRGGSLTNCDPQSIVSWDLGPIVSDTWHDFVVHVMWSSDPTVGFVEVWMNGRMVVPQTTLATLYTDQGVYLKQGFYRPSSSLTSTIYQTATERGTSYAAVAP
jgi:polysaccharide lyase-like protein